MSDYRERIYHLKGTPYEIGFTMSFSQPWQLPKTGMAVVIYSAGS